MALGVRNQLDGYFVGARVSRQRPGGKLGKLLVVALWKICPDLPNVFLNDVEVVEKPVARGADVEPSLGAGVQLVIDPIEDVPRVLEPEQQRTRAALLLRRQEVMAARDCACSLTKSFGAQHFAANGTDEFFAGAVSRTTEQSTQDFWRSLGRDCCCHVTYSTPEMCRSRLGYAPQNILIPLFGVIRLNGESHQALSNTFVLIRALRSQ